MNFGKIFRPSLTSYFITVHGNWGNPALTTTPPNSTGEDFGAFYVDIATGEQGALDTGRQLLFNSFNNSYIDAAGGFTLKVTTGTAFASVTMSTYTGASTPGVPQGQGTWYTYGGMGVVNLTANFVFYVQVGATVYAFAATSYTPAGGATNNQGTYIFEVKTL